ncbi:MAG: hypothetical protein E7207_08610 [Clostridium butyricum]|nr:hypothetical protein [Clostridium butyricum]
MEKSSEKNDKQINDEEALGKVKQKSEIKSDDYIELIKKAKEPFKREIANIFTKDEKLIYIRQQIEKYSIMKEESLISSFMTIFISFIFVFSMILLFARISNTIFCKSLMFTLVVISGVIWMVVFSIMKKNNKNYSIILFALEEIKAKLIGSIGGADDETSSLNRELKNINNSIEETKQQVKESYAIIEQKFKDRIYN